MKINTKSLKSALKDLQPLSKSKVGIIGAGILKIETDAKMKLSVSSIDMSGTREIDFAGEVAELYVNFTQFLWSIGDSEEITILQESGAIIVKSGNKSSRLQTLNAKDFPTMPKQEDFKFIGVPCADLAIGLKAVQGFQQASVIGSSLMNTNIVGSPKLVTCTATDGRNIANYASPLISADFDVLVPSEFCDALAGALGSNNAQLAISERGACVTFEGGGFFCKLSEGKFPSSAIFLDRDMKLLGPLETKSLIDEISSRNHFAEPGKFPFLELEFSKSGIATQFDGRELKNQISGDFQPHKAKVGCEPILKCLNAIGDTCKVYADENCLKFINGDLSIWSMNLLK